MEQLINDFTPYPDPEYQEGGGVYLTSESIALAALVDAMDNRVFKRWE